MGQQHFRISGPADARKVEHAHPTRDPRTVGDLGKHTTAPKIHHFDKHSTPGSAPGAGFEVHLPEFNAVVESLATQCNEFMDAMDGANGLATQLPDGSGPIASIVGHAFNHRLGADGGMQYALRTHVEHLSRIVSSLQQMAATYQDGEDQAASAINGAAPQPDGTS